MQKIPKSLLTRVRIQQPEKETYQSTRKHAADYMRTHPDDFLPFLPSEDDPENMMGPGKSFRAPYGQNLSPHCPHCAPDEFRRYCDTVEKTAEWGGEPEVRYSSESGNRCFAHRRALRNRSGLSRCTTRPLSLSSRPGQTWSNTGPTFRANAPCSFRELHRAGLLSRSTAADLSFRTCGTTDITARCTVSESTTTRCGRRRTERRTSCRRRPPQQIRSVSGSSQPDYVQPRPRLCRQTRRVHLQARMFWKYLFAVQQPTPLRACLQPVSRGTRPEQQQLSEQRVECLLSLRAPVAKCWRAERGSPLAYHARQRRLPTSLLRSHCVALAHCSDSRANFYPSQPRSRILMIRLAADLVSGCHLTSPQDLSQYCMHGETANERFC